MPKIFNTKNVSFEEHKSRIPEFLWHTSARLAEISNAKHFQFDIRSLDPGKFSLPYHFHRAAEELFAILSGEVTLRSPEGFQKLSEDDIVFSNKELKEHTSFITTAILRVFALICAQLSGLMSVSILIQEK